MSTEETAQPGSAIQIKRAYDIVGPDDGYRVLVERLWPRGIKREDAAWDAWLKEIAPSAELRRWFHEDRDGRWPEFVRRYQHELASHAALVDDLRRQAHEGPLTLIISSKDIERNSAGVLKQVIEEGSDDAAPR